MADPKPNQITACNLGLNGEKEFVLARKGWPFSILTSALLPVPTVTYLDYDFVRDIKPSGSQVNPLKNWQNTLLTPSPNIGLGLSEGVCSTDQSDTLWTPQNFPIMCGKF